MKQGGRPTILTHALSTAFCGLFIEFKKDQIINMAIFMSGCGFNGTVSKCRHKCRELVMHCMGFSSKERKGLDTAKEATLSALPNYIAAQKPFTNRKTIRDEGHP